MLLQSGVVVGPLLLLAAAVAAEPDASGRDGGSWPPGVWETTVGVPERLTLLGAAAQPPKSDALRSMPAAPLPFEADAGGARSADGKVALRFPLAGDEEIYGLGVDFKSLRRTGSVSGCTSTTGAASRGAPTPRCRSTSRAAATASSWTPLATSTSTWARRCGSRRSRKPPVVDRTTGGKAWSAQPRSDSVEALVPAPGVRVLVFGGPTPLDAVRRYNLWSGGGSPAAQVGPRLHDPHARRLQRDRRARRGGGVPQARHPARHAGARARLARPRLPVLVRVGQRRASPIRRGFLAALRRAARAREPVVQPVRVAHGAALRRGSCPYAGSHLVWNGIVPDYSLAEARTVFADHLWRKVVGLQPAAVGGFKVDEVDGYDRWLWPDLAVFPSGHDAEQLRQTYGLLLQRLLFDLFRRANRRTLGQVRGTNAGASPFPFVIYNDNYAFDEYITAVANSSFAGVLWSPEVRERRRRRTCCAASRRSASRRSRSSTAGPRAPSCGRTPRSRTTSARRSCCACGCCPTGTRPSRSTTSRDARSCGRCRSSPASTSRPRRRPARRHGQPVRDPPVVEAGTSTWSATPCWWPRSRRARRAARSLLPQGKWFDFYTRPARRRGAGRRRGRRPRCRRSRSSCGTAALVPLVGERQWAPGPDEVLALEVRHYGERPGTTRSLRRRRRDVRLRAGRAFLDAARGRARRGGPAGEAR